MQRLRWAGIVVAVGVIAVTAGAGGAIALEQNDQFCASCHTEPEVTYVHQIELARRQEYARTLAAFHALPGARDTDGVRCIDCHGGVGVVGRAHGLALAVGDTVAFVTGNYEQPARMDRPLPDVACIQCHTDWAGERFFENHIHWQFLEEGAPTDIRCVDCHVSHVEANDFERFIRRELVFPQCEACHVHMGEGPRQMGR